MLKPTIRLLAAATGIILTVVAAFQIVRSRMIKSDERRIEIYTPTAPQARQGKKTLQVDNGSQPESDRKGYDRRAPRDVMVATLSTAAIIVLAVSSYSFYNRFTALSATPPPPASPGRADVVFDRPNVPALLELRVDPVYESLNFTISVDNDYKTPDEINFTLSLSGLIAQPPTLPGDRRTGKNGCWQTIYIIPDQGTRCSLVTMPGHGFPVNKSSPERRLAVEGKILRDGSGSMFTQVAIYPDDLDYATTAGKRTFFNLPAIGTTFIPKSFRGDSPLDYGTGRPAYAPRTLDLITEYQRPLASTERIDFVAPETFEAGDLSWIDTDGSEMSPHGSIVDTVKEETAQSTLFILGVGAGLIGTVAPFIIKAGWNASRRLRSGTPAVARTSHR